MINKKHIPRGYKLVPGSGGGNGCRYRVYYTGLIYDKQKENEVVYTNDRNFLDNVMRRGGKGVDGIVMQHLKKMDSNRKESKQTLCLETTK